MATRSAIGVKLTEDFILGVYCHWDGYPSHNGAVLAEHYTDISKILSLIRLGDISSLRPEIGVEHPFEAQFEDMTTFYGRDRGEENVDFRIFNHIVPFVEHYDGMGADYFYLYDMVKSEWLVSAHGHKFENLQEVLKEETV